MFAYCNNNPVNRSDSSGTISDVVAPMIAEWVAKVVLAGKDETDESGNLTFDAKLNRSGRSFINNLELSVGIGQGLYGELEALELLGAEAGFYCNYAVINYKDGKWHFGQEFYVGATMDILWDQFGFAEYEYKENGKLIDSSKWAIYNDTKDSFTVFSAAAYLLYFGGSVFVGFDAFTFAEDMNEIW